MNEIDLNGDGKEVNHVIVFHIRRIELYHFIKWRKEEPVIGQSFKIKWSSNKENIGTWTFVGRNGRKWILERRFA